MPRIFHIGSGAHPSAPLLQCPLVGQAKIWPESSLPLLPAQRSGYSVYAEEENAKLTDPGHISQFNHYFIFKTTFPVQKHGFGGRGGRPEFCSRAERRRWGWGWQRGVKPSHAPKALLSSSPSQGTKGGRDHNAQQTGGDAAPTGGCEAF